LAQPDPQGKAFASVIRQEIDAGRIPGAVVLYVEHGRVAYRGSVGLRTLTPAHQPLGFDTIFDVASLTKSVATTTAVMQLVEAGRLDLDSPVSAYWPEFAQNGKSSITVRQLLTHSSGLPPDIDLRQPWNGKAEGLARVAGVRPASAPGTAFLYSDVNFIVLGELVARTSGEPLDGYLRRHVFDPLGMRDTGFDPPLSERDRIAPTDRQDGQLRWGEVQDPTAYRMGGIAGHAGLFSTASDLSRLATMLLNEGSLGDHEILAPKSVKLMTEAHVLPGGVQRTLGWDVSSPYSAGMDIAFGPGAFGHTGYTGSLLWIDPATRSFLIILTSRLYPNDRGDVMPLRRTLARLITERRARTAGR
jgi:CubicO group peptidase (beta-lactamase class C family)